MRQKTQNRTDLGVPISAWAGVLRINPKEISYVRGFAKVAGKQDAHISARSGAMVVVTGGRPRHEGKTALVEPTVTKLKVGQVFTRDINLKDEDIWLRSRTGIGVFHAADQVQSTV